MTFGFPVGSRNFCRLVWVSWEKFLFCTDRIATTELPNLAPQQRTDDHAATHIPPPNTPRPAAIKPNLPALGTTRPVHLLQEALVIFGSECRYCACLDPVPLLLEAPLVIHEKSWESIDVVEHSYPPVSPWNLVAIPANLARVHFVILRRLHFSLCFRFLLIHATGFSVTPHS